jgi:putative phosphoribosyl transferase
VKWSGASAREVRALVHRKAAEIRRRAKVYRGAGGVDVRGKVVVLVEDGVTTGSVLPLRAAIRGARRRGAVRVVVATPVAAMEAIAELRKEADEVVALFEPEHVIAVAAWYQTFRQVSDTEVLNVLSEARRRDADKEHHRITA